MLAQFFYGPAAGGKRAEVQPAGVPSLLEKHIPLDTGR